MVFIPLKPTYGLDRKARTAEIRTHTREYLSLRRTDQKALTELLALNCVKRGARRLNRIARLGWWRNCLDLGRSRVRTGHDNSGILSLAFEYDPAMANQFGYVTDAVVMQKLGYRFSSREMDRLGFGAGCYIEGWNPFPKQYPDIEIDCAVIDTAWATLFQHPTGQMLANYRHPTALDERFATMTFIEDDPGPLDLVRSFLGRWFRAFVSA